MAPGQRLASDPPWSCWATRHGTRHCGNARWCRRAGLGKREGGVREGSKRSRMEYHAGRISAGGRLWVLSLLKEPRSTKQWPSCHVYGLWCYVRTIRISISTFGLLCIYFLLVDKGMYCLHHTVCCRSNMIIDHRFQWISSLDRHHVKVIVLQGIQWEEWNNA